MEGILKQYNIHAIKQNNQVFVEQDKFGKLLEMSNIRTSTNTFLSDEISILYIKTKGGIQKKCCLTERGFFKLICSSRKPMAVLIADKLGLNVSHKYVVPETSFIINIKQAFYGEDMITQFSVGKYSIDLYFPKYKLAIEFDEFRHKFTQEQDKLRQEFIISKLNCRFERIKEDENIFISINKIYKFIQFN